MHSLLHLNGSTTFRRNFAPSGAGMYIGDSTVDFCGINHFAKNMAFSKGGGIDTRDSVIKFIGKDVFVANSAGSKGAAMHTSSTTLIFQGNSSFVNNSAEWGGGIHVEGSNITFVHNRSITYMKIPSPCISCKFFNDGFNLPTILNHVFLNNLALRGGALYFDIYSNFSLYQTAHLHFQGNHATEFGGAIYVVDVPGSNVLFFQQHTPFRSKCFF